MRLSIKVRHHPIESRQSLSAGRLAMRGHPLVHLGLEVLGDRNPMTTKHLDCRALSKPKVGVDNTKRVHETRHGVFYFRRHRTGSWLRKVRDLL